MKLNSELINIISIVVGAIGSIITLVGIAISIAGMQQQPQQTEPQTCTLGNIIAGEGATVNITCTVAP